jgi:hypothetical protein
MLFDMRYVDSDMHNPDLQILDNYVERTQQTPILNFCRESVFANSKRCNEQRVTISIFHKLGYKLKLYNLSGLCAPGIIVSLVHSAS